MLSLVDKRHEAVILRLTDHLPTWDQLRVEPVQNVLQIVTLLRLLTVKELQELLDKVRGDIDLQTLHVSSLANNELKEEFVDPLQMRPCRIDDNLILINPCFTRT
jgi:hypothetical protein